MFEFIRMFLTKRPLPGGIWESRVGFPAIGACFKVCSGVQEWEISFDFDFGCGFVQTCCRLRDVCCVWDSV